MGATKDNPTTVWVKQNEDQCTRHNFDDAIDLAGNGWYSIGLLITLSVALLAMCLDLFSFSVVVAFSSCDLQLTLAQKSILVTVPFVGPILTAYAWGYFSDTKGRKKSLIIGMWVSFIMSTLCAFSPNWIMMGVVKLIGTCFCSCAQSASYALFGESCADRVKRSYLLVMTSVVHLGLPVYMTISYFVGKLDFSYDLGLITFVPWRLLILILAAPLGISALLLVFFFESPKFLLNAGNEASALEVLRKIYKRNGGSKEYPVQNLILNEEGNVTHKEETLLSSLWQQTVPLFKPPLLFRTMILYFLVFASYAVSGSLYIWLPFLAQAFTSEDATVDSGLCSLISLKSTITSETATCTSSSAAIELPIVVASIASGVFFSSVNVIMSKFASRRKATLMVIYLFACICCLLIPLIPNKFAGLFYFGGFSLSLCMGPIFSYYVDVIPTSFRGMAACLGVMASRMGSVAGINLVGPFITTYCSTTFYSLSAYLFSAVLVCLLLPPDKPKTSSTN